MRYALFAALVLGGCSSSSEEQVRFSEPVPTPVQVGVVECPPAPAYCSGVQVQMRAGGYGCYNYWIEHTVATRGTTVRATLGKVTIGELCMTANGPARGHFALDPQRLPEVVEFALDGRVDRYALRRHADTLALAPLATSFTTASP